MTLAVFRNIGFSHVAAFNNFTAYIAAKSRGKTYRCQIYGSTKGLLRNGGSLPVRITRTSDPRILLFNHKFYADAT